MEDNFETEEIKMENKFGFKKKKDSFTDFFDSNEEEEQDSIRMRVIKNKKDSDSNEKETDLKKNTIKIPKSLKNEHHKIEIKIED